MEKMISGRIDELQSIKCKSIFIMCHDWEFRSIQLDKLIKLNEYILNGIHRMRYPRLYEKRHISNRYVHYNTLSYH